MQRMMYRNRSRTRRPRKAASPDLVLTGPLPADPRDRVIHLAGREALRRNRVNGCMDPNLRIRLCAGLPEGDPVELTKALTMNADAIALARRYLAVAKRLRARAPMPPVPSASRVPARTAPPVPRRATSPVRVPARAATLVPPALAYWAFCDYVGLTLDAGPPALDELHSTALRMGAPDRSTAADWLERAIDSHDRRRARPERRAA